MSSAKRLKQGVWLTGFILAVNGVCADSPPIQKSEKTPIFRSAKSMTFTVPHSPEFALQGEPRPRYKRLDPVIEKYEVALLMLVGFAGFSILIGSGYQALRRYVFKDGHKFDVIFDAGGRVSLSLTTVTALSQVFWPADFLQSPTIASKAGIGGTLWYSLAVILSVLAFALLCLQLKTRAPGAKTFPQIAYARFGKGPHFMFCIAAMFTNIVVIAILLLSGKSAIEVFTNDSSNEFICLLMAALFGSYCMIGGLGTTFYISYFTTATIFSCVSYFVIKTTFLAQPEMENITSIHAFYETLVCLQGPEGNYDKSLLTNRSETGLIFGVVLLFLTIVVLFCDQAVWQSKIAAKPIEGTVGLVLVSFLWFAVPTTMSYTITQIYNTMSFRNGTHLLSSEDIDAGYITPFVVQTLLGREGCFVFLTMLSMVLMSTGSGEIMSISSVIVYDIIKTHVKPFRKDIEPTDCVLCGQTKLLTSNARCQCPLVTDCADCMLDIKDKLDGNYTEPGFSYRCTIHGKYRHYEDELIRIKSWCMMWVVVGIVPFGLLIIESGMNLNWAFLVCQMFIVPFLPPLFMTIAWSRAKGPALMTGCVLGLVSGVVGMLVYASTFEGGLSDFYTNTSQDFSIITGMLAGFAVSTAASIIMSLSCPNAFASSSTLGKSSSRYRVSNENSTTEDNGEYTDINIEWQKTLSIDNPLNPFRLVYREELEMIGADKVKIITVRHMETILKKPKIIGGVCVAIGFVFFLVVIPAIALSQTVLSEAQLSSWISGCQYWCLIGTVLVVLIPPLQECWHIMKQHKINVNDHTNKMTQKDA